MDDAVNFKGMSFVDYNHRDTIYLQSDPTLPGRYDFSFNLPDLQIRNRGIGPIVVVPPFPPSINRWGTNSDHPDAYSALLSIDKHASVFRVTKTQANLLDGGVAAGLLTLAIGSLFYGRRRASK